MNLTLLLGVILCLLHLGKTFKNSGDSCCDKVQLTSTDAAFLASKYKVFLGTYSLYTSKPSLNDRKVYKSDSTAYCLYWSHDVWRINYCPFTGTGSHSINIRTSDTDNKCPYGGDLVWLWDDKKDSTMKVFCATGSLMVISGFPDGHSTPVLGTSCDFSLPERRYNPFSVTTNDGKTLVCGGFSRKGPARYCAIFDYRYKSWRMPTSSYLLRKDRYDASAVTLSKGVYVLGGTGEDSFKSSEFLATGTTNWLPGPKIPGDGLSQACAAKLNETAFVVLGGWNDGHQARVYNEGSGKEDKGTWTDWPKLRHWVARQSCVTLGDKILMAGGYGGYRERYTGRTILFDSKNGKALEVGSLIHPRGLAAMAVSGGRALIMGGYDGWVKRKDGEVFNMETKKWEKSDKSLKIPQHYLSLVNLAKKVECN